MLDQDACELQCYLEHNCVSINFGFTGTHNCDLNNATHKEHEKDLLKTEGYVYHGTNVSRTSLFCMLSTRPHLNEMSFKTEECLCQHMTIEVSAN